MLSHGGQSGWEDDGGGEEEKGRNCGSDKMVKDRGRRWGVACLAGLRSVWVESIQGYQQAKVFNCTDTRRETHLSPIYMGTGFFHTTGVFLVVSLLLFLYIYIYVYTTAMQFLLGTERKCIHCFTAFSFVMNG